MVVDIPIWNKERLSHSKLKSETRLSCSYNTKMVTFFIFNPRVKMCSDAPYLRFQNEGGSILYLSISQWRWLFLYLRSQHKDGFIPYLRSQNEDGSVPDLRLLDPKIEMMLFHTWDLWRKMDEFHTYLYGHRMKMALCLFYDSRIKTIPFVIFDLRMNFFSLKVKRHTVITFKFELLPDSLRNQQSMQQD